MNYRAERLTKDNFHHFIECYKACFGDDVKTDHFDSKFKNLIRFEDGYLGYLAFEKETNEVAAYYGVFPWKAMDKDKEVLCAQSGDTMTHPNHRRKGLFKFLHDKTMELCKVKNVAFVFGFPNKNSAPGFAKFGWETNSCKCYRVLIDLKKADKLKRKLNRDKFYSQKSKSVKALQVDESQIDQVSLLQESTDFSITREKNYLNYKLSLGSMILKLDHGFAWVNYKQNWMEIGDLFTNDPKATLSELKNLSVSHGIELILFVQPNNAFIEDYLSVFDRVEIIEDYIPFIVNNLSDYPNALSLGYTGGDFDTFL